MPSEYTFVYQGKEKTIMRRDDEDQKRSYSLAKQFFTNGEYNKAIYHYLVSKFLHERHVNYDYIEIEPTLIDRELGMITHISCLRLDGLLVAIYNTERKCEYDPGSRDIYHVWLIEKKLVYAFEKVFRDEDILTGGND